MTRLTKILGWCSQREADGVHQIKGKLTDMHQEEREQLLFFHQEQKELFIQECKIQKELERLE